MFQPKRISNQLERTLLYCDSFASYLYQSIIYPKKLWIELKKQHNIGKNIKTNSAAVLVLLAFYNQTKYAASEHPKPSIIKRHHQENWIFLATVPKPGMVVDKATGKGKWSFGYIP